MNEFVPHKIDSDTSFESDLLGDVKAGFPSPAEDIREKLDLIKLLVKHKAATFFFRVDGVSMVDCDMDEGDIIIVDTRISEGESRVILVLPSTPCCAMLLAGRVLMIILPPSFTASAI